jgi:hypothetical protein
MTWNEKFPPKVGERSDLDAMIEEIERIELAVSLHLRQKPTSVVWRAVPSPKPD